MSVTVKLRFIRHSARKLRPVIRMFTGKNLEKSIEETSIMPQHSAMFLNKVFKMAKAAATSKEFNPKKLVVLSVTATSGPKIKRMRPNARGRSNAYVKHLAHLIVTVDEVPEKLKKKNKRSVNKRELKDAMNNRTTRPAGKKS